MELVQVINIDASSTLSDNECDKLKGTYLDDSSYERVVDFNCDFYCEGKPIFKFRKKPLHEDTLKRGWDNCKYMAKSSRGRGAWC